MGTIISRKRQDGSVGYTAQILRKQKGKIVFREARTFERKQIAAAWLKKRESDLSEPGALERANTPDANLAAAIDRYIVNSKKAIGKTKSQVLNSIKTFDIAEMDCGEIRSHHIVEFANQLSKDRKPQTVGNYLSHLAAVFRIANPAWGYKLDPAAMKDAHIVLRNMGVTAKSDSRDRRPSLEELDALMAHFVGGAQRYPKSAPMHRIVAFAIFSTRRQDEIVRQQRADYEKSNKRLLVRDMKNPGAKKGNDVWCDLPTQAVQIIEAMPKKSDRIFPYKADAISAAFTRACKILGIEDLHFHDLRHDGISRLFEMGMTIPQVASVSGHRSWQSLQRYTHLRASGDKYNGWKWLPEVT